MQNTNKFPYTTIGGEDSAHELPQSEKDRLEASIRREAREDRRLGRVKDATRKNHRATNISRKRSRKADHH